MPQLLAPPVDVENISLGETSKTSLDGHLEQDVLHDTLRAVQAAFAHGSDPVADMAKEIVALRVRVKRRTQALDAMRKAYLTDVNKLKQELMDQAGMGNEYKMNADNKYSIPSLDFRPILRLYAPDDAYLHVSPCETCGGTLEIVHTDVTNILKLEATIASLKRELGTVRSDLVSKRAEADMLRAKSEGADQEALCMKKALLKEVSGLKSKLEGARPEVAAALIQERDSMASCLRQANGRAKELQNQVDHLRERLDEKSEENRSIGEKVDELEYYLRMESDKTQAAELQSDEQAARVRVLQKEAAAFDRERQELLARAEELQGSLRQKEERESKVHKMLEKSKASELTLREEVESLRYEIATSMEGGGLVDEHPTTPGGVGWECPAASSIQSSQRHASVSATPEEDLCRDSAGPAISGAVSALGGADGTRIAALTREVEQKDEEVACMGGIVRSLQDKISQASGALSSDSAHDQKSDGTDGRQDASIKRNNNGLTTSPDVRVPTLVDSYPTADCKDMEQSPQAGGGGNDPKDTPEGTVDDLEARLADVEGSSLQEAVKRGEAMGSDLKARGNHLAIAKARTSLHEHPGLDQKAVQERLMSQLARRHEEKSLLEKAVNDAKQRSAVLESGLMAASSALEAMKQTKRQLEVTVAQEQARANKATADAVQAKKDHQKEVFVLARQLDEAKDQLERRTEMTEGLAAEIKNLQEAVKDYSSLAGEVAAKNEEVEALRKEAQKAQLLVEELKLKVELLDPLQREVIKLEDKLSLMKKTVNDLKERLDALKVQHQATGRSLRESKAEGQVLIQSLVGGLIAVDDWCNGTLIEWRTLRLADPLVAELQGNVPTKIRVVNNIMLARQELRRKRWVTEEGEGGVDQDGGQEELEALAEIQEELGRQRPNVLREWLEYRVRVVGSADLHARTKSTIEERDFLESLCQRRAAQIASLEERSENLQGSRDSLEKEKALIEAKQNELENTLARERAILQTQARELQTYAILQIDHKTEVAEHRRTTRRLNTKEEQYQGLKAQFEKEIAEKAKAFDTAKRAADTMEKAVAQKTCAEDKVASCLKDLEEMRALEMESRAKYETLVEVERLRLATNQAVPTQVLYGDFGREVKTQTEFACPDLTLRQLKPLRSRRGWQYTSVGQCVPAVDTEASCIPGVWWPGFGDAAAEVKRVSKGPEVQWKPGEGGVGGAVRQHWADGPHLTWKLRGQVIGYTKEKGGCGAADRVVELLRQLETARSPPPVEDTADLSNGTLDEQHLPLRGTINNERGRQVEGDPFVASNNIAETRNELLPGNTQSRGRRTTGCDGDEALDVGLFGNSAQRLPSLLPLATHTL